ncbi:MAG: hypothetical protein OEV87_11820 [Phycisphaerae bacterium]|nr:hypothetical protein [Phycisphaerae bacterium]
MKMKKLFMLSFVLGLVSVIHAALTIDAPATAMEGTQFDVIISGGAGESYVVGLYDTNFAAIGIPDNVQVLDAAGNLGSYDIFPSYGGFDFIVDDLQGSGVQAGDWVIATYTAGLAGGSLILDLWDYSVSYETPAVLSIAIIEFTPMLEPVFDISPTSLPMIKMMLLQCQWI